MSSLFGQYWKRAGKDLGIRVEAPFDLSLSDGTVLRFDALVKDFGDKLGILLTTDSGKLKAAERELESLEYGCSLLSEIENGDIYDLDTFKYLLKDWGWSGDPAHTPSWLESVPDPFSGYNYSEKD